MFLDRATLLLHLLLQLSSILHTKAMLEHLSDILKSHSLDLRVAEVYGNPTEEADCGVESECAGRSGVLHLSQES